jgi:hypothetical protein
LFDIHKAGKTPYTCGEINDKHGLQLLEAFHYAIEYVNEIQISRGKVIPFSGLILPHFCACSNPEFRFPMSYVMVFLMFNDMK